MRAMLSALDFRPFRRRLGKRFQADQRHQQHQTRRGSLRHPIRQVRTTRTTSLQATSTSYRRHWKTSQAPTPQTQPLSPVLRPKGVMSRQTPKTPSQRVFVSSIAISQHDRIADLRPQNRCTAHPSKPEHPRSAIQAVSITTRMIVGIGLRGRPAYAGVYPSNPQDHRSIHKSPRVCGGLPTTTPNRHQRGATQT